MQSESTQVPVFSVANHHTPQCGKPPLIEGGAPRTYHGYFENRYGEQSIFIYEYDSGDATLRCGDAGWETTYRVADGKVDGLILNPEELGWLRACWMAIKS